MSMRPNLDSILKLFKQNEDFSLTEKQYLVSTGAPLPKGTYYLKKNSAVAKIAKDNGYDIIVQERTIKFEKKKN